MFKSTIVITQISKSKILRATTNAPKYVTNHTQHTDFNIPYVSDVIREIINKYHNKPEAHTSPLLQPLLQPVNTRRLNRCWPLDLQGTWSDIAGWIPYYAIVEVNRNITAHAQKPDFVFRRNGRVHLNRRGASVQSTTGSRDVRISGSNAGYTVFRGSVKSTGYPLHSPVSPSLPLPCVTVCHHISTGV